MYCSECGAQLTNNPKFCSNCGHSINGNNAPAGQVIVDLSPEPPVPKGVTASSLGTKWLKFWNYFKLPVGGFLGLLISRFFVSTVPALAFIMVSISCLQFILAYWLHHRRLWAWQWNWVLIVITYISSAIPIPTPGAHSGEA